MAEYSWLNNIVDGASDTYDTVSKGVSNVYDSVAGVDYEAAMAAGHTPGASSGYDWSGLAGSALSGAKTAGNFLTSKNAASMYDVMGKGAAAYWGHQDAKAANGLSSLALNNAISQQNRAIGREELQENNLQTGFESSGLAGLSLDALKKKRETVDVGRNINV